MKTQSNKINKTRLAWFTRGLLVVLVSLFIAACDSVPTETAPNFGNTNRILGYTGPSCTISNSCTFKVEFWNKMVNTPCANCHDSQASTTQTPFFLESTNVNTAYTQALTVVDLVTPGDSTIVSKIAGGHNCGDAGACTAFASVVQGYIENWAMGGAPTSGAETNNVIVLTPPDIRDTGTSRSFPATGNTVGTNSTSFANTIWPIVNTNCSNCHKESASIPQSPFFAEDDIDAAYDALITSQKINLDDPAVSRLVVRLDPEFHNCWATPTATDPTGCITSGQLMLTAITQFRDGIPLTQVDPALVISKALDLTDGIIASGGTRDDSSTIALYEMKTGQGATLYDTSGVEPALNLDLSGTADIDYKWVGGWGIEFISGRAQGSAQNTKIRDEIASSGEYSIEAWVVPGNVNQGTAGDPARIITYSAGPAVTDRNFTLGQAEYRYEHFNRNPNDPGGTQSLITDAVDEDLQASQQHVVVTYDATNGRKIYVNGVDVSTVGNDAGSVDPVAGGDVLNWDDSYAFILGSEAGGTDQWQGKLRMVAIHDRAMTPAQVTQNFEAGVGEKFFLMFSVSHLMDDTDCYLASAITPSNPLGDQCFIYMLVSQFDSYSYLFNAPTFISLNPAFTPSNTVIKGMRVGVNGKEPVVGQAFSNIGKGTALTINGTYDPANGGQVLSNIGTIIALEKGAGADEFFLSFEEFGSNNDGNLHADAEYVCDVTNIAACLTTPTDGVPAADIGMRTFSEINATMSAITGVSMNNAGVSTTYNLVEQQLPSTEDINTFLSAHEIGVAQLAIKYCSELVDDAGTIPRATYFPGFNFNADANSVSDADWQNLVIKPLVNRMMTVDMDNLPAKALGTQPDPAAVSAELLTLITNPADVRLSNDSVPTSNDGIPDGLAKCGGACPAGRTALVVKATCAAMLGSAVSLVQ